MAYSTIIKKHCKCSPDCKLWPTMSCFGYNYNHLPEDLKEKAGTKKRVQIKNKNKRTSMAAKMRSLQRDLSRQNELELWFKVKMNNSKKICENCGKSLENYNETDWYGSQHHIVEKSLCPSVKSNPYNHLVLGKWCCHSQWHTSFLNASKMPVFDLAKRLFQLFREDILESEMRKINPYLLE